MSSARSETSEPVVLGSDWLWPLLGVEAPSEGAEVALRGRRYVLSGGLLREREVLSATQDQTSEVFVVQVAPARHVRVADRAGPGAALAAGALRPRRVAEFWAVHGRRPLLVDAGCGAGYSALALFASALPTIRYLGVDVSAAVDVAAARFAERGMPGTFMQADVTALPLAEGSVDVVFSEGVLHHTDSTRAALLSLARLLARTAGSSSTSIAAKGRCGSSPTT